MKSLPILALLGLAALGAAQSKTYHYSHDLSSLAVATPGLTTAQRRVFLDIQLTDGSQLGDGTTEIRLKNFQLAGGTLGPNLPNVGDVTVGMDGIVRLRDTSAAMNGLAEYTRAMDIPVGAKTPQLQFDFEVIANGFDTPIPDYFAVSLLLSDESQIGTDGNVGAESLGLKVLRFPLPQPEYFTASDDYAAQRRAAGDGRFTNLARPTTTNPVPEPATLAALGLGAAAMLRRRKRAA